MRLPPSSVSITTIYPGASAEVVADSVAAVATLMGGLTFTGSAKHFVKFRDSRAPLGYDVDKDEVAVKVSGRRGLGVKADDLLDALQAKARAEVDARDPDRDPGAREDTATAVATGASDSTQKPSKPQIGPSNAAPVSRSMARFFDACPPSTSSR